MSSAISRGLVGMETLLPVGDVELCVDTVGSPADIPLLLIGTTVATWDDALVERLTGRFVIRYDLRDTGRSTTVDPDSPGYTLRDLVTDAVGVLDGLGIARAHVVGIATGGFIAQLLALDHPSRVALARAGRHLPGRAGPRRRRPARALPGDHGLLRQRSTVRLDRPHVILDVRWPRPACFPARHSSTPPRPASTRPVFSIAPARTRRRHERPAERGVLEAGLHATLA